MKTVIAIVAAVILLAFTASAQQQPKVTGFIENQTNFESGGETSTGINGLINVAVTKKVGLFAFGQTSKSYSQIYGGPTYSPKPWLQVGGGIGVEQAQHPLRFGGFVWAGKGKVSNLLIGERGATDGSGFYKDVFNVQVAPRVGVGIFAHRFLGIGPYGQLKLSKHFLLWGAPTYDVPSRKAKGTAALQFNF